MTVNALHTVTRAPHRQNKNQKNVEPLRFFPTVAALS